MQRPTREEIVHNLLGLQHRLREQLAQSTAMIQAIQELAHAAVRSSDNCKWTLESIQSQLTMLQQEFMPSAQEEQSTTSGFLRPSGETPAASRSISGLPMPADPPPAPTSRRSTRKGAKGARTKRKSRRHSSLAAAMEARGHNIFPLPDKVVAQLKKRTSTATPPKRFRKRKAK